MAFDTDRSEVQDPLIKDLWRHTSHFVQITNDIRSMRKEMTLYIKTKQRDGQIENLVPIVMLNEKIDCATAMNQSYQLLHNEVMGLYQTRVRILERAQQNSDTVPKKFIQGCLNFLFLKTSLTRLLQLFGGYIKSCDRNANDVISFTVQLPKANSNSTVQTKSFEIEALKG
ncbi:hypothetical protein N7493_008096 [Penicillium malachiteum]|uniref:Uncharacterized protein n=1 Tax=Penicillium malachiteum TaxID=1324776 RepID=A0AAD6MTL8_9EURO|nr:hypothetical protein N7493_008096 [Penicillium malachiteum]